MNITVDKQLAECSATLRAEIPAEHAQKERKAIVKAFSSQAKISGFRPGKIPTSVIEKRFADGIRQELEQRLVSEACQGALKQEDDLKVLQFRQPEDVNFADDGSMSFSMNLILAPSFDLPDYKDIEVKVPSSEAKDEELEHELKSLQERFAEYEDIEDRALQDDDIAIIDYTSTLEGKPLSEAMDNPADTLVGKEDYWVQIKEDSFLPGFTDQIKGASVGDEREVTCNISDEFPIEELRGKDLLFAVKIKGIKEQKLPEINEEFVKETIKFGDEKTVDDLKDFLKERITETKLEKIQELKVVQIMNHLTSQVDFPLPEDLLNAEAQSSADQMVARGAQQGMSDEEIAEQQDQIVSTAQGQAKTNLKTNFILQEIANAENIEVTDDEVVQRVVQIAQEQKKQPKALMRELQRDNRLPNLQNSILIGKAIDFLVDSANIKEVEDDAVPTEE